MNANNTGPFGAHASTNVVSGGGPTPPPSVAQAFLTGLRSRMAECSHDLQQMLQDATQNGLVSTEDPSMQHFIDAVEHLNAAQHMATSLATPLAISEQHVQTFKAALQIAQQNAMDGAAQPPINRAQDTPAQQLTALLNKNKNDALQAEAEIILARFWNQGIAHHYRKRAELLESAYFGNGDERAVVVLLRHDKEMAESAFADASTVDSSTQLSGAAYVHRDAMIRCGGILIWYGKPYREPVQSGWNTR
ncbi:unnamed protein product, partial [Ectocarpus sp. 8 AP-2014]